MKETVDVLTDIAPDHPEKARIEATLRSLVTGLRGSWNVELFVTGPGTWWFLSFERPTDGFQATALLGPADQTPSRLAACVRRLLAEA